MPIEPSDDKNSKIIYPTDINYQGENIKILCTVGRFIIGAPGFNVAHSENAPKDVDSTSS